MNILKYNSRPVNIVWQKIIKMRNQLKNQFKKSFLIVKTENLIAFKISQYV
jgi:hypothetical protein